MQTLKRGLVATLLLLSPLAQAEGLQDRLTAFFAEKLAGFSDDVTVTVRTPPNLYPTCDQPSFSVVGFTKLWGNVNVLARCANEKRYLQVAVQPIQLSMLRQAWRVKAGQQVMVVANGDGFSINSEGKALNNAAVAQNARVRMSSGQVVSGTVDADGNILINL